MTKRTDIPTLAALLAKNADLYDAEDERGLKADGERKTNRHHERGGTAFIAMEGLKEAIVSTRAADMTDAAIQVMLAYSGVDIVRSSGFDEDSIRAELKKAQRALAGGGDGRQPDRCGVPDPDRRRAHHAETFRLRRQRQFGGKAGDCLARLEVLLRPGPDSFNLSFSRIQRSLQGFERQTGSRSIACPRP